MTIHNNLFILLLVFTLIPAAGQTQALMSWEFANKTGNEAQGLATSVMNISNVAPSGRLTRGAGLQPDANDDSFSSTDWSTSMTFDPNSTDYLEFTIAPEAGYALTLTSIFMNWHKSGNGPDAIALTSSLDNHTTPIEVYAVPNASPNSYTYTLTGFTNLNQAVTFRLYGYLAAQANGVGRLEGVGADLVINGQVVSCGITAAGPLEVVCPGSPSIDPLTDMVTLEIPYEGMNANATVTATLGMGGPVLSVGGDNPTVDDTGVIQVTGLAEGQPYFVSITGGICDYTFSGVVFANECTINCAVLPTGLAIDCASITPDPDNVTFAIPYIGDLSGLTLSVDPMVTVVDDPVNDVITVTGAVEGQTYSVTITDNTTCRTDAIVSVPADLCVSRPDRPFINEFHYNDNGGDIENFIEIAVPLTGPFASVPLSDIEVVLYDGNTGTFDRSTVVDPNAMGSEVAAGTPAQGYQFYVWKSGDIIDGKGGIALIVEGVVFEFLSYGGEFTALTGRLGGLTTEDVGWTEDETTPAGTSIQRKGDCSPLNVSCPDGLFWEGEIPETSGAINLSEVLPITLKSFTAFAERETVVLEWVTANELDNEYFRVERSTDGRVFRPIGRVKGVGSTELETSYRFVDEAPLPGRGYYRLQQVDFDGTTAYYGPIAVDRNGVGVAPVRVYPNPNRFGFVILEGELQRGTRVRLLDVAGRTLRQWTLEEAQVRRELPLGSLAPGVYFLRLEDGSNLRTVRFVRQ